MEVFFVKYRSWIISLYFLKFYFTLKTLIKIVIYSFMFDILTSIDILCTLMSLKSLTFHIIAHCVKPDIQNYCIFHLMELHYRVVTPSVQVGLKGTYGYRCPLVDRLLFYIIGVALAVFGKGRIVFTPITLKAIYYFSNSRGGITFRSDY